tara:strand:+ start:683 stop:913 length:231 start_codon:yes stop_codon:yes gene_type:complete
MINLSPFNRNNETEEIYVSKKIVDEPGFKRHAINDTDNNIVVLQTVSGDDNLNGSYIVSHEQIKKMADLIGYKGDK